MLRKILLPLALAVALAACVAPPAGQPTTVLSPPAAETAASPGTTQALPASTAASTPAAGDTAVPVTGSGDDIRTYTILPDQSRASYEVGETFLNQNNRFSVAVGTTNVISGEVYLNFTHPEQSTLSDITIDISRLTSDSTRRDDQIRRNWLESTRFPTVTFKPTRVEGLPQQYAMGSDITFKVTGDMTVRDTTRPVTFDVSARLENDRLTGTATTQILMTDFNFQPPDIAGMLKAENQAKIKFEFVAAPS